MVRVTPFSSAKARLAALSRLRTGTDSMSAGRGSIGGEGVTLSGYLMDRASYCPATTCDDVGAGSFVAMHGAPFLVRGVQEVAEVFGQVPDKALADDLFPAWRRRCAIRSGAAARANRRCGAARPRLWGRELAEASALWSRAASAPLRSHGTSGTVQRAGGRTSPWRVVGPGPLRFHKRRGAAGGEREEGARPDKVVITCEVQRGGCGGTGCGGGPFCEVLSKEGILCRSIT